MNPQDPSPLDTSPPEPTTVQLPTDPKQQVLERLKGTVNVLLTVSANPSVDQLAAAIGFTLVLNKLKKHGTTVFSGDTPPAISFLEPEKTIQKNVDSLRDFIIALDKSKADKLRYKVEDRFVKIFITPYHTNISENDLEFGQGDFNVDVIIALGVGRREDLDQAIRAHGRILHDATVVSITTGDVGDDMGSINWHVPGASSYSEILADLSESLGSPQTELFDQQIATAFLTGIVAETERFSNDKTTPQTMSLAGILMKAGANQKLISANLESPQPQPAEAPAAALTPQPTPPEPVVQAAPEPAAIPTPEPVPPPTPQPAPAPVPTHPPAPEAAPEPKEEASHISLEMPPSPPEPKEAPIDNIDIDGDGVLHKFGEAKPVDLPAPAIAPITPPIVAATALPVVDLNPPSPAFNLGTPPITPPTVDRDDETLEEIEKAVNSSHLKENGGQTVLSPEHGGQPTAPLAALNSVPIDLDLGHGDQSAPEAPLPASPQPGLGFNLPNPFGGPTVSDVFPAPNPNVPMATMPPDQLIMPTNTPTPPTANPAQNQTLPPPTPPPMVPPSMTPPPMNPTT